MKQTKKSVFHRELVVAGAVLAACAVLLASASLSASVSAVSSRTPKRSIARNDERRLRQAGLRVRLTSTRSTEFRDALTALARLDEPGALDVWQAALANADPVLQREAWSEYRLVQAELARKQFIPQITRINATADEVVRLADSNGLDVTIWSAGDTQTVAAAPPYLIDRLQSAGMNTKILYSSVADWQKARASGDVVAQAITPQYQSAGADSGSQMRIAVIDLADRAAVSSGYSDWLGDREDILMRDGSRIAYLDIFPSDGSPASIDARIAERYTRRGYKLAGFYTPEEFADIAPRLFPGKNFDAGRRAKRVPAGDLRMSLANGRFHSYDDTVAEFKDLAASHPDLARYSKLGSSFEGREIFALKISKNASVDDASKPDVLITGCHHAREWISVESPVYIANQLLSGYATDDSIKYLVDHLQVWIVPIMNPDGLTYTQNSPNDQVDPVRLWRKNRRPISLGNCSSSIGVDLNRNYNYQWRLRDDAPCADYCSEDRSCLKDDIGASDDPRSEIYRGPAPESEPEVKALKTLVDDPSRRFRAQLDYHNYSQLILYPWGYAPFGTDDANTLSRLGQRMSDAVFGVDKMRYRPEQAVDLYALTGSSIDYAYGVNRVPAPFVIEMRPICCDFTVPESEILVVNRENWAGARSLLNWAAGPPILESVKASTIAADGTFSKLVYSAHWSPSPDDPANKRQMVVDTRFAGIEPGRLQVRLQFSRPMNTSLAPRATLGRDARLDEVTFSAINENEGWQKAVYADDTWIGETVVIGDENLTSPWQLAVSATDPLAFLLDAVPATTATYTAGVSRWQNYEGSSGEGNNGGIDTQHVIGPGLRGDYPNVLIASPNGGERLAGEDSYTVVWTSPNAPGFPQSLSLSTDGGESYVSLVENIPSNAQRYEVSIPRVSTARARIRLLAYEPTSLNFLFAASQADFSIGLNVGSNLDISFVSSERLDLGWSDTSSNDPASTASGASRLTVNLKITNRGSTAILNPFLRVAELTRHVLLTRDPKSRWTEGARQTIDAGADNALSPGETVDARLVIGLVNAKKFFLSVEIYGVPSGGTINPAAAVNVWSGKPKTR
ncbi:MAG: M14 family metallopeptidase [Acidobacteriota bacterium]